MMNLLTKLKFWAEHKYNVILEGFHGTGKTESVKQVFNELYGKQGEDWLYFSAATMDAWVDFVGVPREVTDADGTTYLDLIRPRAIAKGTVKAIFFDEFNRAPAKTRNAVMELLQFKSINGRELPNLEIIWAAINPDDDDTYDVERLDPAQKDRFHVHVKIPYDVSTEYFFEKYGRIGEYACDWWKKLKTEDKRMISPRRLDTAVQMFLDDGDISDVLPTAEGINPRPLVVQMQEGSYIRKLNFYMMSNDTAAAREAFVGENFYDGVVKEIFDYSKHGYHYIKFCVPLLPNEKLLSLINDNKLKIVNWLTETQEYKNYSHIFDPFILINEVKENREKNKVLTSTVSKIKMWKKRSGGSDILSDNEFLNMISDKQMNIEFFKNDDEKTSMLNRIIHMVNVNKTLSKVECTKLLGPAIELYRAGFHMTEVKRLLQELNNIFRTRFEINMFDIMDHNLPGLRSGSNQNAFASTKDQLEKEGIIDRTETRFLGE
jgi:hypothetical protein